METTKDITQIKTLEQLYKANIDVHINYLLTLNGYMSISKKGYMDTAPILEAIRQELYEKNFSGMGQVYLPTINTLVKVDLGIMLLNHGLLGTEKFIDYNLKESDVFTLTIVVYLSRIIKSLPNLKDENGLSSAIGAIIKDLKKKVPEGIIMNASLSISMMEQYLFSLRCIYNEKDSFIRYIYEILSELKALVTLINMLTNNSIDASSLERVFKTFEEDLSVKNASELADTVDKIISSIKELNKLSITKHL